MVLFAATELAVFSAVADGARTVDTIADACGAQGEPLRMLLEACVTEGLLEKDGDSYRNAAVTDAFLVKGRPAYIAHGLMAPHMATAAKGA